MAFAPIPSLVHYFKIKFTQFSANQIYIISSFDAYNETSTSIYSRFIYIEKKQLKMLDFLALSQFSSGFRVIKSRPINRQYICITCNVSQGGPIHAWSKGHAERTLVFGYARLILSALCNAVLFLGQFELQWLF